jgi:putative phage-type endonuclease
MSRKNKGGFEEQLFEMVYKRWLECEEVSSDAKEMYKHIEGVLKVFNKEDNFLKWSEYIALKNKVPASNMKLFLSSLNTNIETVDELDIKKKLDWVNEQIQHEQKSAEWFAYRKSVVTASAAYKVLSGLPSEYKSLLQSKVEASSDYSQITGKAIMHGNLYESVAQHIYEKKNKVKIREYGCIKHKNPEVSYVGASPDGIVEFIEIGGDNNFIGRMLEIKCPYSRKLTGVPLYSYWIQCQIQLEVCDLEYCDFLECIFKEYNETDFKEKYGNCLPEFYGVIIQYKEGSINHTKYIYTEENFENSFENKIQKELNSVMEQESIDITKYSYWVLEQEITTLIKRDRDWFMSIRGELKSFWDEVLEKRKITTISPNIESKKVLKIEFETNAKKTWQGG